MTRLFRRLPIRVTVPLLLTAPLAVVVAVLAYLGLEQARFTANDLVSQSLTQVHERIGQRLDGLLRLPERFNAVIAALMREGHLDPDDPRAWRRTLLTQARAFPELSAMDWGTTDGRVVWLARYAGKRSYTFAIKDARTGDNVEIFELDADGNLGSRPINAYPFDPRVRPWYTPAIAAGGPAWSDPFLWVPQDASEATLGISCNQPYRDADGRILGVHDAELSLHDLSVFLEGLAVAKSGRAYITDDDGLLVASSTGTPVATADRGRVAAADAADPLLRTVAPHLARGRPGSQIAVEHDGRAHVLMATSFERGNLRWTVSTVVPEEDFLAGVAAQRRRSIALGIVAVALTLGLGVVLGIRMVRPFLELVGQIRGIAAGELDRDVRIEATPEFARVSTEINRMTEQLRDRARLESELAVATQIQMSMLPGAGGASDATDRYEIAAVLTPAKAVGGDLYDFFPLDDGRLCVIIGDVSDKGVPAALFMAKSVTLARLMAADAASPAAMVPDLNRELCRDNDACMFVTFLCAFVDPASGRVVYTSAGHDPPAIVDPGGAVRLLEPESGAALGLYEEAEYDDCTFALEPGETLVLYTDGVTEAADLDGGFFGEARLLAALAGDGSRPARDTIAAVVDAVHAFEAGAPQADDVTLLALAFRPTSDAPVERVPGDGVRHEVGAGSDGVDRARAWLAATLAGLDVSAPAADPLAAAVVAVVENVVRDGRPTGPVRIAVGVVASRVAVRVEAEGPPFNPLEGAGGDPGTAGLAQIKSRVDRVVHGRERGHNVVTLEKIVSGDRSGAREPMRPEDTP